MAQRRASGPESLMESVRSICPECRQVIDAQILSQDNRVLMRKRCPTHGPFESLLFGDAALYTEIRRSTRRNRPSLQFATEVREGCPHDCGLCPDHGQHSCVGLIEINSDCNLRCPLCCADAGTSVSQGGFELTYEQVDFMLDCFVAAEGRPEVVQFSGGEPTLHPRLFDFVELAREKGIDYVLVNSNGLRIAEDDDLLANLNRHKPHVYLQFDGFEEETYRVLRGRPDLLQVKLRALDRLAQADVRVVLVPAIERGVNDHEIGRIVEFGLRHPAVFGINFQPVFRAQRHPAADPLTRITIPDVLKAVESQTSGLFRLSDFVPVPCCAPTCHFVTYALLDGDAVTPLPRLLQMNRILDTLENRTMPRLSDDLLKTLERLWRVPSAVGSSRLASGVRQVMLGGLGLKSGSPEVARLADLLAHPDSVTADGRTVERCPACQSHLPLSAHAPRDLGRHVFMVSVRDFMDPWTFDIRDVMNCCVAFLIPDGRMIPFCAYNSVGYREQVTRSLAAVAPAAH